MCSCNARLRAHCRRRRGSHPKPGVALAHSPWTGLGAPEGPFSDASLLNGFIIIPTNLNGELTRDIAAELLNQQLATPRVTQLAFDSGGIEAAQKPPDSSHRAAISSSSARTISTSSRPAFSIA